MLCHYIVLTAVPIAQLDFKNGTYRALILEINSNLIPVFRVRTSGWLGMAVPEHDDGHADQDDSYSNPIRYRGPN